MPTTGRIRRLLFLFMAILVALTVHRLSCAPPIQQELNFSGSMMGTTYTVKLIAPTLLSEVDRAVLEREIVAALAEVDSLMSTYRSDSEVSRFNSYQGTEPFPISLSTQEVIRMSQEVSRMSEGAFDITVSPLVSAWGFGADGAVIQEPPGAELLEELKEYVGFAGLTLDTALSVLAKADRRTVIDLSAIAKGFAVDQVAQRLEALGYERYLIEVGGELTARGRRLDGKWWQVGVERPDFEARSIYQVIPLKDLAMASSGDYRNFLDLSRGRVSHIIDPRTGYPISHNLTAVTVLHPDGAMADALATTLSVLGPEEGLAWAEVYDIMALFIVRNDSGELESFESEAMVAYLSVY